MSEEVLTEVSDGVAVITINRPAARNAVNGAVARGIAAALDEFDANTDVRVLILTGAGGTFSAGMDLKGFLSGDSPSFEDRGFGGIVERPPVKPIIAAVEGYALAGGFELTLACDLVVASEEAKFGLPEVRRGLVAGRRWSAPAAEAHPLPPGHGDRPERRALPGGKAAPGWPGQPARAGRRGAERSEGTRSQDRSRRPARADCYQAGNRRIG